MKKELKRIDISIEELDKIPNNTPKDYTISENFSLDKDDEVYLEEAYNNDNVYSVYMDGWLEGFAYVNEFAEPLFIVTIYEPHGYDLWGNILIVHGHESICMVNISDNTHKTIYTR